MNIVFVAIKKQELQKAPIKLNSKLKMNLDAENLENDVLKIHKQKLPNKKQPENKATLRQAGLKHTFPLQIRD